MYMVVAHTSIFVAVCLFAAENVELLLPLVVEYDIAILLKECDQYFMEKLKSSTNSEDFVEYLLLAQRYRMSLAYDLSVSHLARLPLKAMKNIEGTPDISSSTMSDILAKRVELLETDPSADKGPSIPVSHCNTVKSLI